MGKKRSIDSSIRSSARFAALTFRQRDLWHGLIAVADDQGRLPGVTLYVGSKVWPFAGVAEADVEADLTVLESCEKPFIMRYEAEGSIYLQILRWWRFQVGSWFGPSDFPAPPGWVDRVRVQGAGRQLTKENWDQPGGFDGEQRPGMPGSADD